MALDLGYTQGSFRLTHGRKYLNPIHTVGSYGLVDASNVTLMFYLLGGGLSKDRLKVLAAATHARYVRQMGQRANGQPVKTLKSFESHLRAAAGRCGGSLTRKQLDAEGWKYLFSTIPRNNNTARSGTNRNNARRERRRNSVRIDNRKA